VQQRRHTRTAVIGLALMGALLLAACAPPAPAARLLVAGDHLAGTTPDEADVAYGPAPEHLLDVYLTSATERRGTIVFVHGGGFTSGDKETLTAGTFGPVLAQLARGFDLVSVDYRLAPLHPFPAALDDVALAISWVRAQGATHGLDTSSVIVLGHSAGGSLAEMVGTSPGMGTEFGTIPRVDRWVAIAAMSDFGGRGLLDDFPGNWGLTSAGARMMASPLNTLDRTDPPGYLIHGDMDGFVADWHSVFMATKAQQVGADVGFDHITSGSSDCRGHFGPCGADLNQLQAFLG
jgi:acetyl esterase/lipase